MSTDYRTELQRLVKAYDDHGGRWPAEDVQAMHNAVEAARTALAQPEPEGPTVMQILALSDEIESEELGAIDLVRRALARWGRPTTKPVPVAGRLPGPEDCDAEGRCWIGMWNEIDGEQIPDWELSTPAHYTWKGITAISCWLPHHALPIPTP